MGFRTFTPISVAALNNNIDDDLIFTDNNSVISKTNSDGNLTLCGGVLSTGYGIGVGHSPGIILYGTGGGNKILVKIPSNGSTLWNDALTVGHNVGLDHAYLDIHGCQINDVGEPSVDKDALNFHPWATWTPTLVWGTATPSSISTFARYVQIGKTVHFNFGVSSADSNGCTSLTFTLPITPKDNSFYNAFTGFEYVGTVGFIDPVPYNLQSGNIVSFGLFRDSVDNQVIQLTVCGTYEVA